MKGTIGDHGPTLTVGGYLTSAGGFASDRFAVWRCSDSLLFADGLELGDTSLWSSTQPQRAVRAVGCDPWK